MIANSAPRVQDSENRFDFDVETENGFLPEVQAAHPEWAKRGKSAKQKLHAKLTAALPKLASAESDMRRAFNRWDKLRSEVQRIEKTLDRLEKETR